MLDRQDYADVSKTSNLYTLEELQALMPAVDLEGVRKASGFPAPKEVLVDDVALLEASASFFTEEHLPQLKALMKYYLLSGFGSALSRDFSDAETAFQSVQYGMDLTVSDEETAAQLVQGYLADYLGEAYVERYFTPEAKADVEAMIDEILDVYAQRIQALDWMSETTKAKAIEKLEAITVNVGYPDKWDDLYDDVDILSAADGGSYFDNILAMTEATLADMAAAQDDPVDRGEWLMSVYTVNAYYSPQNNSINFPAGILQSPPL